MKKYYVVWSKKPVGWLTKVPGKRTLFRQDTREFPEDHIRLEMARGMPDVFQIYPVRGRFRRPGR